MRKKQAFAVIIAMILTFVQSGWVSAEDITADIYGDEELGFDISDDTDKDDATGAEEIVIDINDDTDKDYDAEEIIDIDELSYGYIGEDYEAPHLYTDLDDSVVFASNLYPEYYNGYSNGIMPSQVRNQGSEGTCWAHAALGCVEIDLIANHGADNDIDLSELQLAYFTAHNHTDPKGCHNEETVSFQSLDGSNYLNNGGNGMLAYHALINMVGPVEESNVPYSLGNQYAVPEMYALGFDCAQVRDVQIIPVDDRDGIKGAVMEHGGVTVSYYATTSDNMVTTTSGNTYNTYVKSISPEISTYYCTVPSTNHAVIIVGWDDNMPGSYFGNSSNRPEGNGAWLVRNSWGGQGYGSKGYFWMSYYDVSLLSSKNAYAYNSDFTVNDNVYSYEGISVAHRKYLGAIGAQQDYRIDAGEVITAVGFETFSTQLRATAYVSDGKRTVSGTTETLYTGFYTIRLDESLYIAEDTTVTVKIMYESLCNEKITIACEYEDTDPAVQVGQSSHWIELGHKTDGLNRKLLYADGSEKVPSSDICMKVFTDNAERSFSVEYVNLEMSGNIDVNVYISQHGYTSNELAGIRARIECEGEGYDVDIRELECSVGQFSGAVYYCFTNNVAAKDMDKRMVIHLYDSAGALIPISNSNINDGTGYACSVYDYVRAVNRGDDRQLKELVNAMAAYGAFAECYFGERELDAAVNRMVDVIGLENYNNMISLYPAINAGRLEKYEKKETGTIPGIEYIGTSLLLENTTGIRHYFLIEDGYSVKDFTFRIGNKICEPVEKSGICYIDISDITADKYDNTFELSVSSEENIYGQVRYMLSYSVYSYLYDVLADEALISNEKLAHLVRFMFIYCMEAKDYVI